MSVADVIATRIVSDDRGNSVEIMIFRPRPDGHGDFLCEYVLKGCGFSGHLRKAHGTDTLQALMLVLQVIGSDLDAICAARGLDLRYVGATRPRDFGLPMLSRPKD